MQNQKGEGTVWACVITVVACMLLALMLTFFEVLETVKTSKLEARTVLNAMVTENAVDVFGGLRDSESSTGQIAEELYTERLADFAELTVNGDILTKEQNGREVYSITSPALALDSETLTVTYTLSVPLYFAGQKSGPAVVPVTVTAKYRNKYE